MLELLKLAEGYKNRFPEGCEPFQMTMRLPEDSGIKKLKYGEPSKENLVVEIQQPLAALMQIAIYYGMEKELELSVRESLSKMKSEGLID